MNSTWLITSELANKRAESTIHLCGFILKKIFGCSFCDIQNNQGRGKGYQPKPNAEAYISYLDLDYSTEVHNSIVLLYIE